jgi:fructose-1,6-bisphosphatase
MDLYANKIFKNAAEARGKVCRITSEKEGDFVALNNLEG